jgi:NADP-dependent 3-hydroxy acid dehydrogenase YdfG
MGEAVAKHLAGKGWKIAVLDMNEKSGQSVANEIRGDFFKTDVTSQESQTDAFKAVWEKYGQIDFGTFRTCGPI